VTLYSSKKSFKSSFIGIFLVSAMALSSCQDGNSTANMVKDDVRGRNFQTINANFTPYPPVLKMFACKPQEKAFVAAHRGTHAESEYPENSVISLQALVKNNVPFAEIDVARLKDGTQIVFHDGVWDRRTVGPKNVMELPLAATTWKQSQSLLLKDTGGNITAVRPSAFADVLSYAKNKIYLEIDFKSSAIEAEVISAIRKADMLDQVILISYTIDQALRLHSLAPTTALSVGIFKPEDIKALEVQGIPINVMTAWTGKGPLTQELSDALRSKSIPILAASFFAVDGKVKQTGNQNLYTKFAKLPDLIVTDSAFSAQQVLEITGESLNTMEICLANK
jgi:glycerophosphoryl diester phosphodiesterase